MALLDISLVTRSLQKLVQKYIEASDAWSGSLTVSISPPDKLTGDNTVGLYLYHIAESPDTRNLPAPSGNTPPIRYTPMGLELFYQLTAHSEQAEEDSATEREQLMMGLAMKALRDFPVIDDSTVVINKKRNPSERTQILHAALRGEENRLRIVLQSIPHNEAVSYWTAGSSPLRLAAYYRVAVVLLEPEEPTALAGRVLDYGIQTFVGLGPRLDGSENILTFTVPGQQASQQLKVRPAQVPVGSEVVFTGANLTGDETRLLLRNNRWQESQQAGPAWRVSSPTGGRLLATVRSTIGNETVLPGMYSAQVEVVERHRLPDGSERVFEHRSNETPFAIAPASKI